MVLDIGFGYLARAFWSILRDAAIFIAVNLNFSLLLAFGSG
ncbi:MAG: hypothetical protein OXC93_02130 [Rhodospirillaceae bacterium]|nr:hypothetical protein [Rhodospirillaceae bacterium]